ncbi:hypothetical protein TRVA0_013S00430 [Trichomonascus vanleenenianus]|uniref:Eco1p n=1 Tax=Trichomonascus vanleenenianus TaxID=2268995 RepID=UPI003ECB7715
MMKTYGKSKRRKSSALFDHSVEPFSSPNNSTTSSPVLFSEARRSTTYSPSPQPSSPLSPLSPISSRSPSPMPEDNWSADESTEKEVTTDRKNKRREPTSPLSAVSSESNENEISIGDESLISSPLSSPDSTPRSPVLSPSPAPIVSKPTGNKRTKLTQMCLDLGQKTQITCKECGMSYTPVDQSDSALHKKFHARAFEGREWPIEPSKVVQTFDNGDQIIKINGDSKLSEKRAAEELMELVNTELSAPPENPYWKQSTGKGAAYVYLSAKRAVAVVVVERITEAKWMDISTGEIIQSEAPKKAILGISRLFTARNFRRNGIALKLLNQASRNFIYGMSIGKLMIAWSQPSAAGSLVAKNWSGFEYNSSRCKVLVYIE